MIHLRVRTEFSFRETFAPLPRVVERLKAIGATAAGIVDRAGSTWGHVRWEKALLDAGLSPLFGLEVNVGREPPGAPAWALAAGNPAALYELGSRAHLQGAAAGSGPFLTADQFLGATGLVRFTGSALSSGLDPGDAADAGCWFDVNPGSALGTGKTLSAARRYAPGRVVLTGDNFFPRPQDRKIHELSGRVTKPTPQHILTEGELAAFAAASGMSPEATRAAFDNAAAIVAQIGDCRLQRAPLIKVAGDVESLCRLGQQQRLAAGQIATWSDEYEQRLQRELALVREKQFDSYFIVVADMVRWAKERMLVGPARGSAAGSLMCYVMGITEVDPLPHGLLFERFVDVTRAELPDIDLDFPDAKRDSVYEYLRGKYGDAQVARIGTVSEYKPRSALGEVAKRLGIPPWETKAVKDAMFTRSSGDSRANNCLTDTLNETAPGIALKEKFPAIVLAGEIEGHASHAGVHAAGVIVCNEPIKRFCTVVDGVAQLDKIDAEALNLLKIDALGLRTLSVIEDAGVVTQEELYRMRFDDPAVYALLNAGRFSGIFQWEGQALQSLTSQVHMSRFEDMVHITALARPGPLGGGAATKFIDRHAGREQPEVAHESMWPYLRDTYGLVLYQEQVMRIARDIGQLSWKDTSDLRKAMSKSYGKEFFDKYAERFVEGARAALGMNKREALSIWDQINSMGSWAFNASHSVSYAIVSYWTAWLKAHYPLQYAAASLRNAKDDEAAFNLLREIVAEGVEYVPFDAERSEMNWSVQDGKLIGGFLGLKGVGPATAMAMLREREAGGLTDKQRAKLAACKIIFADLYPAHSQWGQYYERGVVTVNGRKEKAINIADFPADGGHVLFIGQLRSKDSRDYNEAVRLHKRNGKRMRGQTLFLDMRVTDDSTLAPLLCRIDRHDYEPVGRMILERGREDHDWFLIRGEKLRNFPMVQVHKIRCLNDPELLREQRSTVERQSVR